MDETESVPKEAGRGSNVYGEAFDILFHPSEGETMVSTKGAAPVTGVAQIKPVKPLSAEGSKKPVNPGEDGLVLDSREKADSAGAAAIPKKRVSYSKRKVSLQEGVLENLEAITDPVKVEMDSEVTNKSLYQV